MDFSSIQFTVCPVCRSARIAFALEAADHTVSHRSFEIWECADCSLRFTQHAPDAASIGAFYQSENYISHSNTSRGLINRLYHFVRKQTLMGKRRLIGSVTGLQKGRLLDIGAGTGAFVQYMESHGWQTTGLEPDAGARQRALEAHRATLLPMEAFMQLEAGSFDAITLWHVLEHVHDLHDYIEQLKKILNPSGRIFIAVPNYTSYDAAVYKSYWAAYDVPRHLYHFSPASMKRLLQQHALQLHAIRPMWYDAFYISMLSEKYSSGRSNIIGSVFTGAVSDLKALFSRECCSSLIYVAGK